MVKTPGRLPLVYESADPWPDEPTRCSVRHTFPLPSRKLDLGKRAGDLAVTKRTRPILWSDCACDARQPRRSYAMAAKPKSKAKNKKASKPLAQLAKLICQEHERATEGLHNAVLHAVRC